VLFYFKLHLFTVKYWFFKLFISEYSKY